MKLAIIRHTSRITAITARTPRALSLSDEGRRSAINDCPLADDQARVQAHNSSFFAPDVVLRLRSSCREFATRLGEGYRASRMPLCGPSSQPHDAISKRRGHDERVRERVGARDDPVP